MGFFSIFSKEKKQELDEGLQKSKESFFAKLAKTVVGKSKVDDDVLDNLEEVLVTSDVGVPTAPATENSPTRASARMWTAARAIEKQPIITYLFEERNRRS